MVASSELVVAVDRDLAELVVAVASNLVGLGVLHSLLVVMDLVALLVRSAAVKDTPR